MEILGRKLVIKNITPFREGKCYWIDVYQRDGKEYCDKLNSRGKEQCDDSCRGLFLTTEVYEGKDNIFVDKNATMMVIPSHGFVDKVTFRAGLGLPDFDLFDKAIAEWQKNPSLQGILRIETEYVGEVKIYSINDMPVAWRKNKCSMENAFRFAEALPENLDYSKFGFLGEAYETLAIIGMSRTQLDACKTEMSYDEMLDEAAAIADTPDGWDFLYDRFDPQFIRDVKSFLRHRREEQKD